MYISTPAKQRKPHFGFPVRTAQSWAAVRTRETYMGVYGRFVRFADATLGRLAGVADLDLQTRTG